MFARVRSALPTGDAVARAALRLSALWLCAFVAVNVPCFSLIMAIVGSGSVGLVCFVLPPMFLLKLAGAGVVSKTATQVLVLRAMFAFGVIACVSSLWVGATGECN